MKADMFGEQVEDLDRCIGQAISRFFKERGLAFDLGCFLDQTSVDLHQMALEAHFYGAELFPEVTRDQPTAA